MRKVIFNIPMTFAAVATCFYISMILSCDTYTVNIKVLFDIEDDNIVKFNDTASRINEKEIELVLRDDAVSKKKNEIDKLTNEYSSTYGSQSDEKGEFEKTVDFTKRISMLNDINERRSQMQKMILSKIQSSSFPKLLNTDIVIYLGCHNAKYDADREELSFELRLSTESSYERKRLVNKRINNVDQVLTENHNGKVGIVLYHGHDANGEMVPYMCHKVKVTISGFKDVNAARQAKNRIEKDDVLCLNGRVWHAQYKMTSGSIAKDTDPSAQGFWKMACNHDSVIHVRIEADDFGLSHLSPKDKLKATVTKKE